MIQAMQLQYDAAKQPTHQDDGGCGYYRGQKRFCGRRGCGSQRRGNWRGGRGRRGSSYIKHYCWTHGMCEQPGTDYRTLTEGHKKNAVWCNNMLGR